MRNEVNNWQQFGFFILTYKTKHTTDGSLTPLRARKNVIISILFQKVCLGRKLFPIINRRGGGGRVGMKWLENNFIIKLIQKGYFQTKRKNENYHRILHIQINTDSKFQLQQTTLILKQISKKGILSAENREKTNITIQLLIFELVLESIFSLI